MKRQRSKVRKSIPTSQLCTSAFCFFHCFGDGAAMVANVPVLERQIVICNVPRFEFREGLDFHKASNDALENRRDTGRHVPDERL